MGTTNTVAAADAWRDKYNTIKKIALNLEQAITITDVTHPQCQLFLYTPYTSDNFDMSSTFNYIPRILI